MKLGLNALPHSFDLKWPSVTIVIVKSAYFCADVEKENCSTSHIRCTRLPLLLPKPCQSLFWLWSSQHESAFVTSATYEQSAVIALPCCKAVVAARECCCRQSRMRTFAAEVHMSFDRHHSPLPQFSKWPLCRKTFGLWKHNANLCQA